MVTGFAHKVELYFVCKAAATTESMVSVGKSARIARWICKRKHDPRTAKGNAHIIYAEGQPPMPKYGDLVHLWAVGRLAKESSVVRQK